MTESEQIGRMESECALEHASPPKQARGETSLYLHPVEIDISEYHSLIALRLLLEHAEFSDKC